MAAQFEYTVVELPANALKTRERDVAELLNSVAAHGWRLVSVTGTPGQGGSKTYGYFERPAPADV